MDTMEHATLLQNVQPRVELHQVPAPLALESAVSSPYLVEAAAAPTTPTPSSAATPPALTMIPAPTPSARLTLMSAS